MSAKMWVIGGGLTAGVLGLSVWAGMRNRSVVALPPTPHDLDVQAGKDLPATVLQQAIMRIGLHKKALPAPQMEAAINNALALQLPKTATSLQSIARDGKTSGPNYIPLPMDEMWPGTQQSVISYISDAMKALSNQATA